MKTKMTKHCIEDRVDRFTEILMTVGLGEIIHIFPSSNEFGPIEYCITDTGVLLIRNPEQNTIITGYLAKVDKVYALYKGAGLQAPQRLLQIVKNNEKKRKYLYKM